MKRLELKIHPPIVLLIAISSAYLCAHFSATDTLPSSLRNTYWIVGLLGVLIASAGVVQFKLAQTTVNPTKPQSTSELVTNGIYNLTRNPMYLGMALVQLAVILKLGNILGLITLPAFILYITYFQIKPEEKIIEALFGKQYITYRTKVRRWL